MYNFNIDDAVKHVKTIVENNRCVFCDQLNVLFVRYLCGHSTCSNCVETAQGCLLCLTLPDASAHFADEPSSKRVKNASELLIAFQELFQIDVYRRHRVSEKLKLEKQFFPECIQASTKYCNKRKSLNSTGKENKRVSRLPGENISYNLSKMENTVKYVEKWLNKNESVQMSHHKNLPRKPFTDLNVNQTNNKDANNLSLQTSNKRSLGRKRTHLKIIKANTSNVPKVSYKRVKSNTNIKEYGLQECNENNKKCENNESGICIDDEVIDIDDSECEIIDKDRRAWLEVLQAEKNENSVDCGIESSMNENEIIDKDRRAWLEVLQAEKNENSVDCGIESSMNENEIIDKDRRAWLEVLQAEKNENSVDCGIESSMNENEIIGKDRRAWLEVLQAEKNENSVDCGIESSMNENEIRTSDNFDEPNKRQDALKTYRVPFFKKSTLVDVCNSATDKLKDITETTQTSKNITVTIDGESFVTTIKVSNLAEGASCANKQSTAAQTDNDRAHTAILADEIEDNKINDPTNVVRDDNVVTEVTTKEAVPNNLNSSAKKRKCLIIEESDSDSDLTDDNINSLEVTAEIHQSDIYNSHGVLSELKQNDYEHRTKHAVRELTPLSSDSSDKENYDPNRIKRQKSEKKNCTKK